MFGYGNHFEYGLTTAVLFDLEKNKSLDLILKYNIFGNLMMYLFLVKRFLH